MKNIHDCHIAELYKAGHVEIAMDYKNLLDAFRGMEYIAEQSINLLEKDLEKEKTKCTASARR